MYYRGVSPLRIVAAIFILSAAVGVVVSDNVKIFMLPLIVGNLLVLWDDRRARRE